MATQKRTLALVVGARPQFIKAAAFFRALDAWAKAHGEPPFDVTLIHTGQHYDAALSANLFEELRIPNPDINLGVGSASHAVQTARMLTGMEELFTAQRPDAVVVFGDTNSTSAAALCAVKLQIPVAHIEAGLRAHDLNIPEEVNRRVTDHISARCYAPSPNAMAILEREGLGERSVWVGDIMLDTTVWVLDRLSQAQRDATLARLGAERGGYILSTVHRAHTRSDPALLRGVFEALRAQERPVILPLHPSTRHSLTVHGLLDLIEPGSALRVIDPLPYADILCLLDGCAGVMTDSGGLVKESYVLRRPCITLLHPTEWVETHAGGWNVIAGPTRDAILAVDPVRSPDPEAFRGDVFGTGHAAMAILEDLDAHI